MRKLRDVFYIYNYPEENYVIYYGMEFNEFKNYEPSKIKNILLLNATFINLYNYDYNPHTRFVTIEQNNMNKFLKEDHYNFGDFVWVDYKESENLNRLSPNEIAELLHLGHKGEPLRSPFFDNLENRYVYYAHDDGWYCKLYYKFKVDIKEILANKIVQTISSKLKSKKIYPMSDEVKEKIYSLCNDGLVVNFNYIDTSNREIKLKFDTIGEFSNMDEMYNDLNRHLLNAKSRGLLTYINKQWKIETGAEYFER